MNKNELKNRIKELELELINLKSGVISTKEAGKQAEKALLEQGEWYRLLFNNVSDAVFLHEVCQDISDIKKFKIIEVNNNACKYLGYTREELLQINIPEIDAPETLENASAGLKKLFIEGRATWEGIHMHKDGHRIPVEISLQLFELNGKPMVLSSVRDITQRKEIEEELRLQSEIISNMTEAVYLVRMADGIIIYVHPFFEKMFGYEQNEMLGKHVSIVNAPTEKSPKQTAKEIMDSINENGFWKGEVENIRKDGTFFTSYASVTLFDHPKFGKISVCIHTDITQRKQAEKTLQESEKRLKFYTDNSPMAVVEWDTDFTVTRWTGDAEKMFGWKSKEVIGKKIMDLNIIYEPDIPIVEKTMEKLTNENYKQVVSTNRNYRKDRSIITCEWYNTILKNQKGEMLSILSQVLDISERKQVEETLRQSEEKYKGIVESQTELICRWLPNETLTFVNDCYCKYFDKKFEELIGNKFTPLIPQEDYHILQKHMALFSPSNPAHTIEHRIIKADGEIRWQQWINKAIYNSENQIIEFQSVGHDITERKQAERELRESVENFRAIFENNSTAMCIIEPDTTISMVNNEYCKIGGYTKEEVIGMSWTQQIPPEDLERLKEYNRRRQIDPNDAPNKYEFTFYKGNGEIRHALMSVIMQSNKKIIASFLDITERKQAEESLKESEEKYRTLVENIGEGIGFVNPDEEFVFANPAAERIFVVGKGKLTGKNLKEFHNEQQYLAVKKQTKLREKGQSSVYEDVLTLPDGKKRNIIITAVPQFDDNKKFIGTYAIFRDITQRKQAEKALQESEEKFRSIMENSADAIFITNRQGKYVYTNKAVSDMLGYTSEEMKSKTIHDIRLPNKNEEDSTFFKQILSEGKGFTEIELLKKDGNYISTDLNAVLLPDGLVFGSCRDITERKQTEEEIINMQESLVLLNNRLEEIRENERTLLSRELHDQIGQSLVALKMDMSWLSGKIASDSEEGKRLHGIVELLTSTIKDVQRISSELHPAMLDNIGLCATMEWYSKEFEQRTGIKCHLKLDDVQIPDEKINLVLYRILQEALTNVARHANAKKVNINLYQAEDSIILEVIDDGIGVEKKKIKSFKSLGFIGMRERAKKYNGTVDISSTLNKGTKLSISIPIN